MIEKLKNSGVLYQLIGLALIGGSIMPLSRLALFDVPATTFMAVRLLVMAILLAVWLRVLKIRVSAKDFRLFVLPATFFWLNIVLFAVGLERTTAINTQFIYIAIPVVTALLAFAILRHKLNKKQWLGVLVAMLGVGTLVASQGEVAIVNGVLIGNLIVFASAICFSLYVVLSKRGKFSHINPIAMVFLGSAMGALVTLPFAITEALAESWWQSVPPSVYLAMVAAGAAGGIFLGLLQYLIKRNGPSIATLAFYLLPISAVFWASLVVDEMLTLGTLVGGLLAFAGVWIATRRRNEKRGS